MFLCNKNIYFVNQLFRRTFVTPRVLEQTRGWKKNKEVPVDDEDGDENDEESSSSKQDGFIPFAENPELVRERWQQKKASKQNQSQRDYAGEILVKFIFFLLKVNRPMPLTVTTLRS